MSYCKQLKKGLKFSNSKICSSHFLNDDFDLEIYNDPETFVKRVKRLLKANAIPSVNIEREVPNDNPSENIEKKVLNDVLTKMDENNEILLRKPNDLVKNENVCNSCGNFFAKKSTKSSRTQRFDKRLLAKKSPIKIKIKQNNVGFQCDIPCNCSDKVTNLAVKNVNATLEIFSLKKESKRLQSKKYLNTYMDEVLRNRGHTKAERRCMMNPKQNRALYSQDDVARAVVLKGISSKAFNYERNRKVLPIPSKRTQERWLSRIKCLPGYLKSTIDMIKTLSEKSGLEHFNETILAFDEVAIHQRYEMDLKTQTIYGNHKKLQMVMARGLVCP